jgi:hypothetical protein
VVARQHEAAAVVGLQAQAVERNGGLYVLMVLKVSIRASSIIGSTAATSCATADQRTAIDAKPAARAASERAILVRRQAVVVAAVMHPDERGQRRRKRWERVLPRLKVCGKPGKSVARQRTRRGQRRVVVVMVIRRLKLMVVMVCVLVVLMLMLLLEVDLVLVLKRMMRM